MLIGGPIGLLRYPSVYKDIMSNECFCTLVRQERAGPEEQTSADLGVVVEQLLPLQ